MAASPKPQPPAPLPAPISDAECWRRVCRRLRSELGEDVFSSWFARIEVDLVQDDQIHLSVPTKFLKSWLQAHYFDKLCATIAQEWAGVRHVSIRLRMNRGAPSAAPAAIPLFSAPPAGGDAGGAPPAASAPAPAEAPAAKFLPPTAAPGLAEGELSGSPLDRRLTFESFMVGRSNHLAHAAALQVAQAGAGEAPAYNPLYIHAAVGLGKTHVLQAIAHAAAQTGRRVVYLTAEKFMYGFVIALKSHSAIAFKEKLRGIDLLVIDDAQFLQGKTCQQEFCHTLNALLDAGKQVVVAADRPPSELENLEERISSRLAGGLCVEMVGLDEDIRVKILNGRLACAKLRESGVQVPPLVVQYIARAIQTNGRDLDGAVNRLVAHATLSHAPLTIETAEAAIRDLVRTKEPRRLKIEDIQKLVAQHFNVSRADILSSRRTAVVVKPRQIAMYLAKMLTSRSLPEIGRRFGGRDHTTVLHAVRKIEGLAGKDANLSEELELLKRMLLE